MEALNALLKIGKKEQSNSQYREIMLFQIPGP